MFIIKLNNHQIWWENRTIVYLDQGNYKEHGIYSGKNCPFRKVLHYDCSQLALSFSRQEGRWNNLPLADQQSSQTNHYILRTYPILQEQSAQMPLRCSLDLNVTEQLLLHFNIHKIHQESLLKKRCPKASMNDEVAGNQKSFHAQHKSQ